MRESFFCCDALRPKTAPSVQFDEALKAPNFPACFLAVECPHLKTDGPCNTVCHCRIGWLAGWWCLDLCRLLANSARADPRSGTDETPRGARGALCRVYRRSLQAVCGCLESPRRKP